MWGFSELASGWVLTSRGLTNCYRITITGSWGDFWFIPLLKTSKVSMSLNDIIDFILNCMYVNIRKCRLLSRTNFVMMSNIMLMFLLLLFLAGDVEKKNLALGTHQSRKPTTNL